MASAKDLIVKPITAQDANRIVRALHYSGKVVNNSQVHLGVFLGGKCGGAMQFGPSLDKRKMLGIVRGTLWNEFVELNRMAFADWLPRNGESRCIGFAMRWLRKTYPWLKWVVSFADGTQCGDGTIYRASGFVLTGIKENNQIWEAPSGKVYQSNSARGVSNCNLVKADAQREALKTLTATRMVMPDTRRPMRGQLLRETASRTTLTRGGHILETGGSSMRLFKDAGWKPKAGFQLRYIYFIDPTARNRLTVPILPFSEIDKRGAGMYKGKQRIQRASSADSGTSGHQPEGGGAIPTDALHLAGVASQ